MLANLAAASFSHLVQVIRHGLKKIQYRPGLIEGCLAGTGLSLHQIERPTGITNQRSWLNTAGCKSEDLQERILGDRPMRGTPPWRHPRDRAVYCPRTGAEVRQIP